MLCACPRLLRLTSSSWRLVLLVLLLVLPSCAEFLCLLALVALLLQVHQVMLLLVAGADRLPPPTKVAHGQMRGAAHCQH